MALNYNITNTTFRYASIRNTPNTPHPLKYMSEIKYY